MTDAGQAGATAEGDPTKGARSRSFGTIASHYERFRPGPPLAAVEWFLPERVGVVVDLGAGTGLLTRLLVDRADEVVAVEPDDRMRAVLVEQVPGVTALEGRAESFALGDASADAILASSSWHWVDPVPAGTEGARRPGPGGSVGAGWAGPRPAGPFMAQARELFAASRDGAASQEPDLGDLILGDSLRPEFVLVIPEGLPFTEPEHEVITWDVALNADELIGLLGTLSWII